MVNLRRLRHLCFAVLMAVLFLGLSSRKESPREEGLDTSVPFSLSISFKKPSIPSESCRHAQLDRLVTWSQDELKRVEKGLEDQGYGIASEKDSVTLLYSKFLWINGKDAESEVLLNSLNDIEDLGASSILGWVNYNLGEIFYLRHYLKRQNTLGKAWSHHRKAKNIFKHAGDSMGLVKSLSRIGVLHERANAVDSARHYFEHSVIIAKKINYRIGLSRPYTHLGFESLSSGDTIKANALIDEVLKINLECANHEELPFSLINKARLTYSSEPDSAKLKVLEAIKLSKKIGFKLAEIHALYHLSGMAQETGDSTLAINSCKEAVSLADQAGYMEYSEAAKSLLKRLKEH